MLEGWPAVGVLWDVAVFQPPQLPSARGRHLLTLSELGNGENTSSHLLSQGSGTSLLE